MRQGEATNWMVPARLCLGFLKGKSPSKGHQRTGDVHGRSSPAFGGAGGPEGGGGTDPLQEQDPWEGAVKKTKDYLTEAKQLQLRAGTPGGEPEDEGDDGDDEDRGSRRNRGDNPEDLSNKFRKSMDKIGGDRPNSSRGRIHRGGGCGGDPSDDGGGGDDGHRLLLNGHFDLQISPLR
eukprot:979103-Amphidinium_carterae.1